MGESGGAAGEAAEGTGTRSGHHSARGGGVVARFEDDGRDVGQGDVDGTAGFRDATTTAAEEGNSSRDGGGGVIARYEDNGRDVGRGDDDATTQDGEGNPVAAGGRGRRERRRRRGSRTSPGRRRRGGGRGRRQRRRQRGRLTSRGRRQRRWARRRRRKDKRQQRRPKRRGGGGEQRTRRRTTGRERTGTCLGTPRPWRTYVSRRSMGTGFMGTRARTWTGGYRRTGGGRGGGVT